jgi:hypothetical protein
MINSKRLVVAAILLVPALCLQAIGAPGKAAAPAKRGSKKAKVVIQNKPIEGLYLELPKTYAVPDHIQLVLKARVQNVKDLEGDYPRFYEDREKLTRWLSVKLGLERDAIASQVVDLERSRDQAVAALRCSSIEEAMSKFNAKVEEAKQCTNLELQQLKLNVAQHYQAAIIPQLQALALRAQWQEVSADLKTLESWQ